MIRFCTVLAALVLASCAPQPSQDMTTGQTLDRLLLMAVMGSGTFTGDQEYAVVKSDWLTSFYPIYRQRLFDQGVVTYDEKYDCSHFALSFVAQVQSAYFVNTFHSRTPSQSAAVGIVWYFSSKTSAHALVVALTESGVRYFEPQTGSFVTLTPEQQASTWLRLF